MRLNLANLPEPEFSPQPVADPLCLLDACELLVRMDRGELSAVEIMKAHLSQIDRFNPAVNAICTRVDGDVLLKQAADADAARAQGRAGVLCGLPMAVKDLVATQGIRTTMGSRHADQIPKSDALLVTRLKAAGAVIVGKTNVPEFGAGSHTFNDLFGVTRNPYDLGRTAGGSSGGAAAALATGMLPLADGSDMGGSLRNPAAFCNVVGFRPSIGRVPSVPTLMAWQSRLAVEGPMARSVRDCARLLSAMAGPDRRDPLSLVLPPEPFDSLAVDGWDGARVAFSPDLGETTVADTVRSVFEDATSVFASIGCAVAPDCPDLSGAMDVFRTLRASYYAQSLGPLHRSGASLKASLAQNVEAGFALTGEDLTRADVQRTRLHVNVCRFFDDFDFLVVPSTQVPPFPVATEWVREIDGQTMGDYLDWMSICCIISATGLPAISVPCGFTPEGLPVGLQIVGPPGGDLAVLRLAAAFEAVTGHGRKRPALIAQG